MQLFTQDMAVVWAREVAEEEEKETWMVAARRHGGIGGRRGRASGMWRSGVPLGRVRIETPPNYPGEYISRHMMNV